jgi:hypothetical protein
MVKLLRAGGSEKPSFRSSSCAGRPSPQAVWPGMLRRLTSRQKDRLEAAQGIDKALLGISAK